MQAPQVSVFRTLKQKKTKHHEHIHKIVGDQYKSLLEVKLNANDKFQKFDEESQRTRKHALDTFKAKDEHRAKIIRQYETDSKVVVPPFVPAAEAPVASIPSVSAVLPNSSAGIPSKFTFGGSNLNVSTVTTASVFPSFQTEVVKAGSIKKTLSFNLGNESQQTEPLTSKATESTKTVAAQSVSAIVPKALTAVTSQAFIHLPYVRDAEAVVNWLSALETQMSQQMNGGGGGGDSTTTLSNNIISLLSRVRQLESPTAVTAIENNMENMEDEQPIIGSWADVISDTVTSLHDMLTTAATTGGTTQFVSHFITVVRCILQEIQSAPSEGLVMLLATTLTGVLDLLPDTLQTESSKLLRALLLKHSCYLCAPDLSLEHNDTMNDNNAYSEKSIRVLTLQAVLIGRSAYVHSPVSASDGYLWLSHAVKQLYFYYTQYQEIKSTTKSTTKLTKRISHSCRVIRIFLRFAGYALLTTYQQKFMQLLTHINTVITTTDNNTTLLTEGSEMKKLADFVNKTISTGILVPIHYKGMSPLAAKAVFRERTLLATKHEVTSINQNRSGPIFTIIKEFQIDRMRNIFNKLSATIESQNIAITSLLDKLVQASRHSPILLRYTSYKIANNLVSDCQEDHFNETDEGHPTKLARVACGLCVKISDFSDVMRAQLSFHCPLTVPRSAEEGLTGDAFLEDMRFKRKKTGGEWESKTLWLARMSKMLCTFSVMLIQPEQTPFSLSDGWQWLTAMTNETLLKAVGTSVTPPFYTATAFEVFLRVTSQQLHHHYGDTFLQLLRVIEKQILPLLALDMPRRDCLAEFLTRFLHSDGRDFMSLFLKLGE